MKNIYFLVVGFCFFGSVNAQIVNIPDAKFKAKLLAANTDNFIAKNLDGSYFKIDLNSDGQIQEIEAQNVSFLNLSNSYISSLEGLSNFSALTYLDCNYNLLTSIDVTSLINVEILSCFGNKLTVLHLTGLVNLKDLKCGGNQLTSLILTPAVQLQSLDCSYNKLTSIDVTPLANIEYVECHHNEVSFLEVKGLSNLKKLDCNNNKIKSLDVTGLVNLKNLNCNNNQIYYLDVTPLKKLQYLLCYENQINSINVKGLVSLKSLDCYNNQLTSVDLTTLKNLESLQCTFNKLAALNVKPLLQLKYLYCSDNRISSLDLTGLVNLEELYCYDNQLTSLDLAHQINLKSLECSTNNITHLFIKHTQLNGIINFTNSIIQYICANDSQMTNIQNSLTNFGVKNCQVNSYCSFTPGGTFYSIQGSTSFDSESNGCDSSDDKNSSSNFRISDGITDGNIISDATGNYSIPVGEGIHIITPILENPNYFTVSPHSISVTFPTQTSPFIQNFCITPNGVHKDLEISIFPTVPARPGFDATYKIIFKNKGNQTQSGSVVLSFNDAVLDLVSAVPATNNQVTDKLTWDFTNLKPLESREISLTFNVNSPMETPPVNNGDRLSFNALITPVTGDAKPVDNSMALRQTVVGSYDPNDKTCLEGDVITPDLIGEYVHYLIRFENTGTFPAENVVIKDLIDLSKFDISTLTPTKASHDYVTKISDGNKVEFIFEKIQLPFDDATNDGYIAFKIKTLPTLVVGDSFTNEANIYFDYNFPILTNTAKSTFQTLGTPDFEFADYFSLYPNPANAIVNIGTNTAIEVKSMAVYDVLGQIIIAIPDASTVSNIDVSKLASGNYFLKMNTNKGTSNGKFIKK